MEAYPFQEIRAHLVDRKNQSCFTITTFRLGTENIICFINQEKV